MPGFAYGLINDAGRTINQAQAGLIKKHARRKFINHRKLVCRQKQTKTADIVKITPGKTHNPATNEASFTGRARLAG